MSRRKSENSVLRKKCIGGMDEGTNFSAAGFFYFCPVNVLFTEAEKSVKKRLRTDNTGERLWNEVHDEHIRYDEST